MRAVLTGWRRRARDRFEMTKSRSWSFAVVAGGERSRASEAVNRSTIAMAPPHCGQSQSGRARRSASSPVTVCESPVLPRSAKQSGNKRRPAPVGEEPEVPDAHESPRQHVQKEAAQKLLDRQPHQPLLVLVSRVAPAERDLPVLQRDQTVIGDRHPVRVTAEIAQRVFGPAERALGIDHPIGAEQPAQHGGERGRCGQARQAAVKAEFAGRVQFPQIRPRTCRERPG